ncbi:hypothetical protein TRIP_B250121 [uncultured Desulfatiglans sp.]|uniref:Uncharacterized protein n=1 Tax=Uncultured Desulfatiglans sp. TaxID=1748965 RepID=A0A653A4S5_UNCDX|nr:hypothetical protein TRIP_B250121 [uncultured Desulfatiglans sp.]
MSAIRGFSLNGWMAQVRPVKRERHLRIGDLLPDDRDWQMVARLGAGRQESFFEEVEYGSQKDPLAHGFVRKRRQGPAVCDGAV